MTKPILVGAVAYAPQVVPIWDGMRDYFREVGPAIDYVLYSNYDRQVQALLDRHIDIAWNTNLAWVKVHRATVGTCRALAMRDVDVRFTTVVVARSDSGINSLADLRGKRLALGSADSAQAAILPRHYLQKAGVQPGSDCTLRLFDLDVGKHGDTGTSELEVLRALRDGQADAGALSEATWNRQVAEQRIDPRQIRVIWTSPGYCHCVFTVLPDFPEDVARAWTEALLKMSYDDPRWRGLMDQEGLKRWVRADDTILEGYRVLFEAVQQQKLGDNWPSQPA
ncbi:MAG TPA: PhnD/SsuA/transferrin family substrate-binding protein [Gemmataceae bacterium]